MFGHVVIERTSVLTRTERRLRQTALPMVVLLQHLVLNGTPHPVSWIGAHCAEVLSGLRPLHDEFVAMADRWLMLKAVDYLRSAAIDALRAASVSRCVRSN